MSNQAMFAGLVVDEHDRPVDVAWVGSDACYVIDDAGFLRHIDAEEVDRQVLRYLKEQVEPHRDLAVRGILQMMGKDDIFSKTAVEYSINRIDEAVGQPLPEQAKAMLRSLGFRIVLDVHGQVLAVDTPGQGDDDWE